MRLPSAVLRLGARIVRELDFENSNDTLGRWMAHHLAELIERAESIEGDGRTEVQERIIDLTLKLWAQRQSLPKGAYPLNELEQVISVVWRLRPEASPFRRMGSNKTEDLLGNIFRRFQRVIVHGIVLTSGIKSMPENLEDFEPFFDENERDLIDNVQRWIEFLNADQREQVRISFTDGATSTTQPPIGDEEASEELDAQSTSKRLLCDELDELIDALSTLKSKLTAKAH